MLHVEQPDPSRCCDAHDRNLQQHVILEAHRPATESNHDEHSEIRPLHAALPTPAVLRMRSTVLDHEREQGAEDDEHERIAVETIA